MKTRYILFAAAVLAVASCTKTVEQPEPESMQLTFRAYQEGALQTRTTVRDGGTKVYWEPADEIKLFFKESSSRFVSQNTELVDIADFTGTLNVISGANEGAGSENQTWGLYPYREDAVSDGYSVTTTLPAEQTGRAGSFARNTHITLAHSSDLKLAFYNVTGGVRFSLSQEGIKSVSFQGNDLEALAGKIKLAFEDGVPVVQEVSEGETVLTLNAPDGGSFETGKWYYIEAIPRLLCAGFKMVFSKGGEVATLSTSGLVTISRGKYGSIANADKGLIFRSADTAEPEYVDLGLSVKWATFNVGATSPEGYGEYFAWGETEPKTDYGWATYKWCKGSSNTLTKYCQADQSDLWAGSGSPDSKTVLELEDDAAHMNWGGSWRMPTDEEWTELRENCSFTWTDNYNGTGVAGDIVTSNKVNFTDKTIFIPAAGCRTGTRFNGVGTFGAYWSSSIKSPEYSYRLYFNSSRVSRSDFGRYFGFSVRPVTE